MENKEYTNEDMIRDLGIKIPTEREHDDQHIQELCEELGVEFGDKVIQETEEPIKTSVHGRIQQHGVIQESIGNLSDGAKKNIDRLFNKMNFDDNSSAKIEKAAQSTRPRRMMQ